jgi:RNA polymerase sigma-70 factor, ECF subfamily
LEAAGQPGRVYDAGGWRAQRYCLCHAIRADLLRRLGLAAEAALACQAGLDRTQNAVERDFLVTRLAQ